MATLFETMTSCPNSGRLRNLPGAANIAKLPGLLRTP